MVPPVRIPAPMRPDEFESEVRDRARFTHEVKFTSHLMKNRLVERDISVRQVINVLRKGAATSSPKWDAEKSNYVAEMTYCSAGRQITVVCAIRRDSVQIIAVTAW